MSNRYGEAAGFRGVATALDDGKRPQFCIWLAALALVLSVVFYWLTGLGTGIEAAAVIMRSGLHERPVFDRSESFEPPGKPVRVHFIDVGQGASVLVQAQDEAMLIDAGSEWMGEHVVQFCRSRGVEVIDIAVATSPGHKRMGGLKYVFDRLPVRLYCDPGPSSLSSPFNQLARAAAAEGIPYSSLQRGETLTLGQQIEIEVLWPPGERTFPSDEGTHLVGSDMLVLSLLIGRVRILLLSDLPMEAERKLLRGKGDLESAVIHLGDHGARSSNSAAVLDEASPQIAIASVGVYNERNVPHVETLQRLAERDIGVLRTDRHGTITLGTDGRRWWVLTERRYNVRPDLEAITE